MEGQKIWDELKQLPEIVAPTGLSRKTMKKIVIYKIRPWIYGFSVLLMINFGFLFYRLYHYLAKSEALLVIGVWLNDFEFSLDYIGNSLLSLKELLPPVDSIALAVNLVIILLLAAVFQRYRHELLSI